MAVVDYADAISASKLTIYDELEKLSVLKIPTPIIQSLLREALIGEDTSAYAIRTRAKVVKRIVCEALGYPVPKSFNRTQPRFPGQDLDIYVQASRNCQVWNEAVVPLRRYAIVIVNDDQKISNVHVISGEDLALFDKTGKLTSKYQAILRCEGPGLISRVDRPAVTTAVGSVPTTNGGVGRGKLLSIGELYKKLKKLEGAILDYSGASRERARGAVLHRAVCEALDIPTFEDNGRFPDIPAQLLELKLQTSQTIDLGLILPNSETPLERLTINGNSVAPADIRYAVFEAKRAQDTLTIVKVYVTTGADFLNTFDLMKGKQKNTKLQIQLPMSFFCDPI